MLLLILGMMWAWLPPVSQLLHQINTVYTESVLNIAYNFPTKLDTVWHVYDLSGGVLLILLSLIYFIGFIMRGLGKENKPSYVF